MRLHLRGVFLLTSVSSVLSLFSSQEARSGSRQLEDSFVMLHPAQGSPTEPAEAPLSSPSAKYQALSRVWALASDETAVDHPMCRDCAEVLQREIEAQAAEAEDAVAAYRALLDDLRTETRQMEAGDAAQMPAGQDVRRLQAAIAAEEAALAADMAALHVAEADLTALAADADAMRQAEVAHDAALAAHELAAAKHTDEVASLRMRTAVASVHLDLLRRTHVFNDAFHIWHDGAFGTISGFRLGRTASVPVDWPEINAAFGQACLLLHTLAHVARFTFSGFTLLPLGSTSRVRDNMRGGTYDLFGPVGGLNLLSAQRFDKAQAGLLACLREFGAFATARDLAGGAAQPFELPYDIEGDRVGGRSVRFSLNSDDKWTAALKLMLTDLKMVLAWTSAAFLTAEGGRA